MNLYFCEINVKLVTVGSLPVNWRFAFASGIEHEVVAHSETGTTIRRTAKVAHSVTDSTGKKLRVSGPSKSEVISSGSEVTPLGASLPPAA